MFDVFVNVPLISPVPLAAIPVTGPDATSPLFLVQLYTLPATLPVNAIVVIVLPLQIDCEAGVATAFGVGFTVIVNVFGVPVQDEAALIVYVGAGLTLFLTQYQRSGYP